jgi:hypothetical protein
VTWAASPRARRPLKGTSKEVVALLAEVELVHGRLTLPGSRVEHWAKVLQALPEGDRLERCVELAALCVRWKRDGGPAAAPAIKEVSRITAKALVASASGWTRR